jgi:ArsR family transcriptional regulator
MDDELYKLIKMFKALSDGTKLGILNMLSFKECCACEVVQVLNISPSRASPNLRILHNAGLVNAKRSGQRIVYNIDKQHRGTIELELITKVRQELEHSQTAMLDMARLKVTERVRPMNNPLRTKTRNTIKGGNKMVTVEIYGPGCLRCHAIRDNVGEALQHLGLKDNDIGKKVKIVQIKDPREAAKKGIILTPALVIDGVKVAENRIPETDEIKHWLKDKLSDK